jgi:hypothetical protein
MNKSIIATTAFTLALCLSAWAAESGEEKVSLDKVPPSVSKSLQQHAGGEKITNVSREKEDGKTVYEGTFKKNGRVHDLTVDENGKLVSDEETIPASEAPPAIQEAIKREHPEGKIQKLERITEGRKISYEALISGKGKREEIKFDEKGKVLEREDKSGSKEKE